MKLSARIAKKLCAFCHVSKKEKILLKRDNFYILVDQGPLVEGYLLLLTTTHTGCMGEVQKEQLTELSVLIEETRSYLTKTYGACTIFEHGDVGTCFQKGTNQFCYHAHVHAVPIRPELILPELKEKFSYQKVKSWAEVQKLYEQDRHYVYFEDLTDKYFFKIPGYLESQFLPKLIVEKLGLPKKVLDFEKYPNRKLMQQTYDRLLPLFLILCIHKIKNRLT